MDLYFSPEDLVRDEIISPPADNIVLTLQALTIASALYGKT